MRKLLPLIISILFALSARGQGDPIYGLWVENSTGLTFLATTDAVTGVIVPIDTLNDVDAIVFQTGAISSSSYQYTFRYLTNGGFRILTVSINTGEILYDAPSDYNIMGFKYGCNDILYALWLDDAGSYHLVSVNPQTGDQTDLGITTDLSGIFFGTFSFDLDNGWYMVRGIDVSGNNRLYSIDVTNGAIVNSPISNENVRGNEYDCTTHLTYGLRNDPTNDMETFVSLDPVSGNSTLIDTLWPVSAVTAETYSLNHNTGEYTFAGLMQSAPHLFTVDVITGDLLYNVLINDVITETDQFSCCGKPNGVDQLADGSINIFPNPADDFLSVEWKNHSETSLRIINPQGQIVVAQEINGAKAMINIQSLMPGIYFLQVSDNQDRIVVKVVKE